MKNLSGLWAFMFFSLFLVKKPGPLGLPRVPRGASGRSQVWEKPGDPGTSQAILDPIPAETVIFDLFWAVRSINSRLWPVWSRLWVQKPSDFDETLSCRESTIVQNALVEGSWGELCEKFVLRRFLNFRVDVHVR